MCRVPLPTSPPTLLRPNITMMEDDSAGIRDIIEELQAASPPEDWRTKWQDVSEAIWSLLDTEKPDIDTAVVDAYLELLQDRSRFALARAVLPALREPGACTPHQQRLVDGSETLRQSIRDLESRRQGHYDEEYFAQEKRVHQTSILHRFGVLLHQSEPLGAPQQDEIRNWLLKAPSLGNPSSAAGGGPERGTYDESQGGSGEQGSAGGGGGSGVMEPTGSAGAAQGSRGKGKGKGRG